MKANGTRWGWQNPRFGTSGLQIRWDGDGIDNYIIGAYTYMGFNYELDCYNYIYGLNEVTVTDQSWAMQECRRLGEQNCGGLSAEYSGGEVNVPTISAGGGGGGGAFCQNDNNNSTTNNVNIEILGDVINIAGLYTYTEKVLAYSEMLGKWTDKMGKRRPLADNGNQYTGGKLKYGKYMSKRFMKASTALNTIGVGLSVVEMAATPNTDDKIKYGADIVFGVIGFAPGGVLISTFWFFGGRELAFQYGYTMGELMKDGINPGMPAYQPFK